MFVMLFVRNICPNLSHDVVGKVSANESEREEERASEKTEVLKSPTAPPPSF